MHSNVDVSKQSKRLIIWNKGSSIQFSIGLLVHKQQLADLIYPMYTTSHSKSSKWDVAPTKKIARV